MSNSQNFFIYQVISSRPKSFLGAKKCFTIVGTIYFFFWKHRFPKGGEGGRGSLALGKYSQIIPFFWTSPLIVSHMIIFLTFWEHMEGVGVLYDI